MTQRVSQGQYPCVGLSREGSGLPWEHPSRDGPQNRVPEMKAEAGSSSMGLVTGESLRPALIPGKGNQMPLDEEVTRSHCRMGSPVSGLWKMLSASVGSRRGDE